MIWQSAEGAAGWSAGAEKREAALAGVSDALLSLAGIGPGQRVLECGCGSGELALVLHAAVGPEGSVLGVDSSPGMIEIARRQGEGRAGLEFEVVDLQQLNAAGFDAAVSRIVLMLVPDELAALRRIHGALKPGARFACSVWAQGENPRFTLPVDIYRELQGEPDPGLSLAKVLRLGREELLRERLEAAGFGDVVTFRVRADTPYAGVDELLHESRRHPGTVELFDALPPQLREAAWRRLDERFAELATTSGLRLAGAQVLALGVSRPGV